MKAIFLDVDGTLLTSDYRIMPRTKASLAECRRRGDMIVILSGRAVRGLDTVCALLGFTPILATLNGAYIVDEEGAVISESTFPAGVVLDMASRIERCGLSYMYFSGSHWGCACDNELYRHEYSIVTREGYQEPIESFIREKKIHKLLSGGSEEANRAIQQELRTIYPEYEILSSSSTYTEMNTPGTDKGHAIREVCKKFGIRVDDAICFGDYNNDIPAFLTAGCPVAMGNAIEEVKTIARYVTASNDEDGIGIWLEEHLL